MTSPRSASEPSAAFERLHEDVRRWIWQRGWESLRDIQEEAINAVLDRSGDVIISAATASGKTEAAFLPICSSLAGDARGGVRALYVGPLKALINDQFARLDELCEALDIPVHRWHGDVSATRKRAALETPGGVLLITPESLEALFVLHGPRLSALFARLDHVVVDELHAFMGTARGRQLQSQLHRLEALLRRRVTRVGLSATLGDMRLAAEHLRPGEGAAVRLIVSTASTQELKVQVRGYPTSAPTDEDDEGDDDGPDEVAAHLFKVLRGGSHLVFANSRERVERLSDLLRRACEEARVPNEFFPHHGGLSRDLRHDVEARLKAGTSPVTVVCTSTLEMGIDVGAVQSVAQVGVPPTVAALRQRLGRSGRRGEAAVLRAYVEEAELAPDLSLAAELRAGLFETVAKVRLLLARWYEPPDPAALHLSTLVQQLLSTVAERGGVRPLDAWGLLCGAKGPFSVVSRATFADFLRSLGEADLLAQQADGTLLLGVRGERLVNHYTFYSAFVTPEEYRVVAGGRELGTVATSIDERTTRFVIFAGRRWEVLAVDHEQRVIDVAPAHAGRALVGGAGDWADVHDRVRFEMRLLYAEAADPVFLDAGARRLLGEGRSAYGRRSLARERVLAQGKDVVVLPWRGTKVVRTLGCLLAARGFEVTIDSFQVEVSDSGVDAVRAGVAAIAADPPPTVAELAAVLRAPAVEKFDEHLSEALRREELRHRALDVEGARAVAREIASGA